MGALWLSESSKGGGLPLDLRGGHSSRKKKNKAMRRKIEQKERWKQPQQQATMNNTLEHPSPEEEVAQSSEGCWDINECRSGSGDSLTYDSFLEEDEESESHENDEEDDEVFNDMSVLIPEESDELEYLQLLEPSWDLEADDVSYYDVPEDFWVDYDSIQSGGHIFNFEVEEEECLRSASTDDFGASQIISMQIEADMKLFADEKECPRFMKFESCNFATNEVEKIRELQFCGN